MSRVDKPRISKIVAPRQELGNVGTTVVHRIVAGELTSRWFTYQQIAVLKTSIALYHACTDYFHGSLPTNCVFVVSEIE